MFSIKKDEQTLTFNLINFKSREKSFKNKDWSVEGRSSFIQEKYALLKLKYSLDSEQLRLQNLKISLDNKNAELEALCQKLTSKDKIKFIAAGILRKNSKFVHQLEEIDSRCKNLSQLVKHANEQLKSVKIRVNFDKPNTHYRVSPSPSSTTNSNNSSLAAIIADAILHDEQAVQLVARSKGSNLELEKNWEMMSEFEKDELETRELLRNI